MQRKTAIVTGATGAIGKAIARLLAEKEFRVILAARNEARAKDAAREINEAVGEDRAAYELADVSRKEEVRRMAERIEGPVDALVNNAGVTPRQRVETPEGIELQWATNALGYFWMIKYFIPHLTAAKSARVVNVSSYWAGGLDLNDPEFKKRPYNNDTAYRQSKQADRMIAYAFAERLKDKNIVVNTCHPGDVNSQLSADLGFGGSESPEQGARMPVWLAADPAGAEHTGRYFAHGRQADCPFRSDRERIEKLYELCERY